MIYSLSLRAVGLAVGLLLVLLHLVALINGKETRQFLRAFPRSKPFGAALLTVDALWAFALILKMDLGEFSTYRQIILIAIAAGYVLTLLFVEEFLAVRALGMFCLLAAEPLLEVSFLQPEPTRLLLVALAYVWATLGLFWVGMPYLLRDQISWISKSDERWRAAALAGLIYGAATLFCALTRYGA